MRRAILLPIVILSVAFGAWAQKPTNSVAKDGANTGPAAHDFASKPAPRPSGAYGDLPLSFEANRGQADSQVKYLARGRGYTLFLTPKETVLALRHASPAAKQKPGANAAAVPPGLKHETVQWVEDVVRFKLAGASADPKMEGVEKLPGVSNYYIGNDPSRWQSGIPNYRKVVYRDAYPGIDVTYYGNPGLLESDFIVAPGADPSVIAWDVEGATKLRVNEAGDLILETADSSMRLQKPVVYQMVAGERREVIGGYRIDHNTVRLAVGGYDRAETLIIDPTLSYSTYLGGSNGQFGDIALGVAVDTAGEAYVTGIASSTDFPTQSPFQGARGDGALENAFVTKFSADGSSLIFSTYLGGTNSDQGYAIALDGSGNAYVAGDAGSDNFPLQNPLEGQSEKSGRQCGFVSSFSATGSLLFSTYLCGGNLDEAVSVTLDSNKNVYVGGITESINFPTVNPLQASLAGTLNTFVAKLAPITPTGGSSLLYSTFFGGNTFDFLQRLALDSSNNIYISGTTNSSVFPTKNPIQATLKAQNGGFNSFVAEINAAGNTLVYSTYLGGSVNDTNDGLAVDSSGNAYVVGTATSPDFPVKNTLQALDPGGDAYVAKIAAGGGSLDFSTFFGPAATAFVLDVKFNFLGGGAIALDSSNNIYITGETNSAALPTRLPLQATIGAEGSQPGFITEFKNDGSDYIFSSYLAGSSSPSFLGDRTFALTLDSNNNIYVVGWASTLDFPTVNPFQADLKNTASTNGFVLKIAPATPAGPQLFPASLNFGPVITATPSQPQIVTLANGTTALDITSIVVSGQNAADFNSFSTCGQTVPATVVCNFTVTFTPSIVGNESALVTINESGGPQSFTLSGTGATTAPTPPPGTISVNPATLPPFASQEVSIPSASQFFNVTVGTNPVTLQFTGATGADPSDFISGSGGTNPCSFGTPLPVGTVCQVAVAFDPTAAGARSATFQVFGTFTGSPAGVSVSGTATAKIASLTPSTLSFANQIVNTTSGAMVVTLMNVSAPGGPTLTSIAPSVPAGFAISSTTCPVGAGLGPGQSCTFNIVFSPTTAGFAFGTFTVTDSDPAPQFVELSGQGLNATATLAAVSPTSLEFGRQTAGSTSSPRDVFLQNTGNTTLTFTTPLSGASPNAFQATNGCSGAIAAASECFVSVTFTPPTGTGPFFGILTIQSGAIGAPQTVLLSGTGIPASTASLLPNPLAFPVTAVGLSSATEYAFLNNTGPVADSVQSFTIIGADPQDFQLSFAPAQACNFGTFLNAQAVCVIGVMFTPQLAGQRTATLQVVDTATGTPQTIPLQGTATSTTGATLTVVEAGTGTGTVTSNPTGITCPATTCAAGFESGTQVVLTATPTGGSTFTSFTTNCAPANPQTNPPSCTVAISGSPTVTVTFTAGSAISPALGITKSHTGNFTQGQHSAQYTVTVSNAANAAASSGTVTVTDTTLTAVAQDIATSFSGTSNPNGVWSYGQYVESPPAFSLLTGQDAAFPTCSLPYWSDTGYPDVIANNTGSTVSCGTVTVPTDMLWMHPTDTGGTDAAVRWTAPASGTYEITGSYSALDSTSTTDSILVNGTSVFSTFICNPGNGKTCDTVNTLTPFSVVETLTAGSTVDFTVNCCTQPGQTFLFDSTGLTGAIDSNLSGLSLVSMFGQGWTCGAPNNAANICTRSDALAPGSNYPPITVLVNVGVNTPSPETNTVTLSGGGSAPSSASDSAIINPIGAPLLAIAKSHTGNFTQGQQGAAYTVTVSNGANAGPTTGTVTVTDTFPAGLTLVSMAGTGWTCAAASCTRSDALAAGASYPGITVTVNVASNASSPQVNMAGVSGGGSVAPPPASDSTVITSTNVTLTITLGGNGTGTVTSSPAGINCGATCSAGFASGTSIVLTATASAGSTFTGWGAGPCEGTGTCTLTIAAATTVVANFAQSTNNFTLAVTEAGTGTGTVSSAPTGINCPTTCSASFASGTVVVLTAFAADGSTFGGWSGVAGCPGTGTCTVTVSAAVTVTATFNSGNSPVTIGLAPGSPSTVNTTPGSSAVFGLTLTALPGTTGTVMLGCTSTSPNITCNIVPSTITLTGKAINVAIVVNTFCKGAVPAFGPSLPGGLLGGLGMLLAGMSLCGAMWRFKRRPRLALSFGVLVLVAVGMSACSNLPKSPGGTATKPGLYPLVVTATAPNGGVSSVNLSLNVLP
jgi:Beta-propeller repeat/Divergent InlB B-repeat domain/Domain of unknown function DUF11